MRGVEFLESLPMWRKGNFSPIDVPKEILAKLDNPQDKIKTIHVAGTNGKGTTSAAIASIIKVAGNKTGFFSSPHLVHATERCRINNQAISLEKFDYYLARVAEVVNWDNHSMTYFVATMAASFLCFLDEKVDYAVIEVGLGGRFDATNIIKKPQISVITNIDYDHQDLLGNSIAEIAENKAGIIKQFVPVVLGELVKEAHEVILNQAKALQAPVYYLDSELSWIDNELMHSVVGQHAARIAARVASLLGISRDDINSGLVNLRWPGRIDFYPEQNVLVDGAHNAAGMRVLFQHLEQMLVRRGIRQILFLLGLKQREGWKESAFEAAKGIENLRANGVIVDLRLIKWEQGVENLNEFFNSAVEVNLQLALESIAKNKLTIVTGSLYLIGEALTFLDKKTSL